MGKFTQTLRQPRPRADKVYVLSHNSTECIAQFLPTRLIEMELPPKLLMDGTKILSFFYLLFIIIFYV